jgi:hypothetical protein
VIGLAAEPSSGCWLAHPLRSRQRLIAMRNDKTERITRIITNSKVTQVFDIMADHGMVFPGKERAWARSYVGLA